MSFIEDCRKYIIRSGLFESNDRIDYFELINDEDAEHWEVMIYPDTGTFPEYYNGISEEFHSFIDFKEKFDELFGDIAFSPKVQQFEEALMEVVDLIDVSHLGEDSKFRAWKENHMKQKDDESEKLESLLKTPYCDLTDEDLKYIQENQE